MSKHLLKNNSKLDLVKGRFKLCLTMFSWSAIVKWRDLCATNSYETTPIDVIHMFDDFGTLGIDLTH